LLNNVGGFYGSLSILAYILNIIFNKSQHEILAAQFYVKVSKNYQRNI